MCARMRACVRVFGHYIASTATNTSGLPFEAIVNSLLRMDSCTWLNCLRFFLLLLTLQSLMYQSLFCFRSFSTEHFLMTWGLQNHAQPPTWSTRIFIFVWFITFDLSGRGMLPATGRQHRGCIIPQAVKHSLVLLKMGKIIARNMLS